MRCIVVVTRLFCLTVFRIVNVNRAYCSFHGKLYCGVRKPSSPNSPFIPARESHRRNNPRHTLPPTTSSLTHDCRSRLFYACTRYITFSPLIHLRVHKEFLALCPPHLPLVIFTGVIFSALKANPLSRTKVREGNRASGKGTFRFSTFDTDSLETKFRFGVGIKEDL